MGMAPAAERVGKDSVLDGYLVTSEWMLDLPKDVTSGQEAVCIPNADQSSCLGLERWCFRRIARGAPDR